MKANGEAMEACQGKTEANPEEKEPESEHPEVSKEEAAVQIFRTLKKRQGGRHLAEGLRGKPKERTQGLCGSRRKLASSRRKMTGRAAWHGARDTGVRYKARTMLQKEPLRDGR
jgi:hypothetical protein